MGIISRIVRQALYQSAATTISALEARIERLEEDMNAAEVLHLRCFRTGAARGTSWVSASVETFCSERGLPRLAADLPLVGRVVHTAAVVAALATSEGRDDYVEMLKDAASEGAALVEANAPRGEALGVVVPKDPRPN